MANVLVEENSLQDIADAIREKTGTSDTYTPAQMGEGVRSISGGGSSDFSTANVTIQSVDSSASPHYFATIMDDGITGLITNRMVAGTYPFVLYKGQALFQGIFTVVSGDAEYSGNILYIRGDCTITVGEL